MTETEQVKIDSRMRRDLRAEPPPMYCVSVGTRGTHIHSQLETKKLEKKKKCGGEYHNTNTAIYPPPPPSPAISNVYTNPVL